MWDDAYENEKRDWFIATLDLIRTRFHTIKDFGVLGRAYFADDYEFEEKALRKNVLKHEGLKDWFPELAKRFEALPEFSHDTVEQVLRQMAEELGIKPGILINGARAVVTGRLAGPSMFEALVAVGRERVVARLKKIETFF